MQSTNGKLYGVIDGKDGPFCVYRTWNQTSQASKQRKGCMMKSFTNMDLCLAWMDKEMHEVIFIPSIKRKREEAVLEVSTDGGCINNGAEDAKASCGVFFGCKDPRNIGFMLPGARQTNNRSEILSAILGVLALDKGTVFTDSMYTINSVKRGEIDTNTRVVNYDLIHLLAVALQDRPNVRLQHVKAHNGDPNNEGADKICTVVLKGNHII
jgi:ribonuclease HI